MGIGSQRIVLVGTVIGVMMLATTGRAQIPTSCMIPPGVNPYYAPVPPECQSPRFNPYLLPPSSPTPTAPVPTTPATPQALAAMPMDSAFLFTGGVVNGFTLTYLDIFNAAYEPQTVRLEYFVAGRPSVTREITLDARSPASIEVHADPEFRGGTLTFSLQVTFEYVGVATLKMQPSAAPWSLAIMPQPRIVDLRAGQ